MVSSDTNPLLSLDGPPLFSRIKPEHVEPAARQRIAQTEAVLEELAAKSEPPTWTGLVEPLDQALESLERAWGPVEHLNSVMNSDELREVYRATKPLLAELWSKLAQDERLLKIYEGVLAQADAEELDTAQRTLLKDGIRDLRLAGVDLSEEKKARYREIMVELSQLSSRFSDNLIDVARDYRLVIEDPAQVEGIPQSVLEQARAQAVEDDAECPESRWTFTLHMPSYAPFMQYMKVRERREELYRAYMTRCTSGETDNSPLIDKVLALRVELAQLLGFKNFAEVSLAPKMADTPEQVLSFLNDLAERSRSYGKRDIEEMREFARQRDQLEDFQVWDYGYYREALRQDRYSFSDDEVRQYFPLGRVLEGLFETLRRLYGVEMREIQSETLPFETWHPDVKILEVVGPDGDPRGYMFLDLFARDGKRQGAWMGGCLDRCQRPGAPVQLPVAYLVCNFAPPLGGKPCLLRHSEVQTLFHECGHALHHVLTQVSTRGVAGINNVPWDGVELPSQFHENWIWQAECLEYLAAHAETSEPLPSELLGKMLAAKNFQSGRDMLRQLELALFDLELHTHYDPKGEQSVQDVLDSVRERVSVLSPPPYSRFQNGFGHIFAGGYAAGYYSYKWAEVLAADAFSRFEEEGIFSPQAGQEFLHWILERGGSQDLMDLYKGFRGREPTSDALMRHSGLAGPVTASAN